MLAWIEVAADLAVFAGVIGFFHSLATEDASASLAGLDLPRVLVPTEIGSALLLIGGAGALSAGAGYLRSVLALSIAQRHADHSVQALLGRIEGSSTPPELHPDFVYSLNRDSAIIYRSARPVVDVVAPAVQALALLALLIWLDAAIAGVVLIIALLALGPLYRLTQVVAEAAREHERTMPAFRRELGDVIDAASMDPETASDRIGDFVGRDSFRSRYGGLRRILLNPPRVLAASRLTGIVGLMAVVVVVGRRDGIGGDELAALLLIAVVLRTFIASSRQVSRSVAVLGRFYPHIARHREVLEYASPVSLDLDLPEAGLVLVETDWKPGAWEAGRLRSEILGEQLGRVVHAGADPLEVPDGVEPVVVLGAARGAELEAIDRWAKDRLVVVIAEQGRAGRLEPMQRHAVSSSSPRIGSDIDDDL